MNDFDLNNLPALLARLDVIISCPLHVRADLPAMHQAAAECSAAIRTLMAQVSSWKENNKAVNGALRAKIDEMEKERDAAVLAEREVCAKVCDEAAEKNRIASIRSARRAKRLGDDPFEHGAIAREAAAELDACFLEAKALAAAIRARSES